MMKKIFVTISLTFLAACSSTQPNSASELIREQQEKQAYIQQAENEQARQAAKDQPSLLLTIIEENISQGRYFAAHAYVKSYIQQFGDDPTIAIHHATTLRAIGNTEQARAIYTQALAGPQKAQALHGLGLLAAKAQQLDHATDYLQQAAELNPTDPVLLSDLGFAYLSTGRIHSARLPLGQAIELAPTNPKVVANVAVLLLLEQHPAQAQKMMAEANFSAQAEQDVHQLAQQLQSGSSTTRMSNQPTFTESSTASPESKLLTVTPEHNAIESSENVNSTPSEPDEEYSPQSVLSVNEWQVESPTVAVEPEPEAPISSATITPPITKQIPLKKATQ